MQKNRTAACDDSVRAQPQPPQPAPPAPQSDALMEERLLRLEHMFLPFADDMLMGELRRLAVKCAQEGLIRG